MLATRKRTRKKAGESAAEIAIGGDGVERDCESHFQGFEGARGAVSSGA